MAGAVRIFKRSPGEIVWQWPLGVLLETLEGVAESYKDGAGITADEFRDAIMGEGA